MSSSYITITYHISYFLILSLLLICSFFNVYFILPSLVFSWFELASITIVILSMTLYELVIHCNNISYLMFFNLISSAELSLFHSILFYSTLFQIDSILFYSIRFDSIESKLLYCSVLYLISMNDLCLSVRLSVCLCVYLYE